jgi:hypothetical protein
MPAKQKISDEQFIEAYMAANGSYTGTASYIQQNFDVPFTRQAAMKRAKRFPNLKRDVLELMENDFDDHLLKLADDETVDLRLRVRIYLQMKSQLNRVKMKVQTMKNERKGVFDIDGNIISFDDDQHDKEAFENIKKGLPGPGFEAYLEERRKKSGNDGLPD